MKDAKEFSEKRVGMWKMREELLNSMSEKELRAFIKGYMMGQRTALKERGSACGCHGGGCEGSSCSCKSESCGCGKEDCNCGKE